MQELHYFYYLILEYEQREKKKTVSPSSVVAKKGMHLTPSDMRFAVAHVFITGAKC